MVRLHSQSPYYMKYIERLETVQHRFFSSKFHRLDSVFGIPLLIKITRLCLNTSKFQHCSLKIIIFYKICNNLLDSPKILVYMFFLEELRSISTFEVARNEYLYLDNLSICLIIRYANELNVH